VELDEMWSFVRLKTSNTSETEEPESKPEQKMVDNGSGLVSTGIPPYFGYWLLAPGHLKPPCTIAMTAGIVLGVPCFFSDGFSCYFNALVEYYHEIKIFPKTGQRGRPKKPVKEPHPGWYTVKW
jgi:hypothetical protein